MNSDIKSSSSSSSGSRNTAAEIRSSDPSTTSDHNTRQSMSMGINISGSNKLKSTDRRFADCALIEIIHLHDCLRGALMQIQTDVQTLVDSATSIGNTNTNGNTANNGVSNDKDMDNDNSNDIDSRCSTKNNTKSNNGDKFDIDRAAHLSNSVASRFHLIFSVFQAHSGAEDEFIWPALKMKIESKKSNQTMAQQQQQQQQQSSSNKCGCESMIEQEEYEEDHAIEENMFKQIHTTLRRLNGSFRYYHAHVTNSKTNNSNINTFTSSTSSSVIPANTNTDKLSCLTIIKNVIFQLKEQTDNLTQHLLNHLEKEETQCLPMVRRHLNKDEISTLVGKIMGQRSAEIMAKILNLAVCSLPVDEREDMVAHMKKAMTGTFFEKWLTTGGWLDDDPGNSSLSTSSTKSSPNTSTAHTLPFPLNNDNNSKFDGSNGKRTLDNITDNQDASHQPPTK